MDYKSNLNPISVLYRSLRLNHDDDSVVSLAPFTTVFLAEDTFFKINFSEFNYDKDFNKLFNLIKRIVEKDTGDAEVVTTDSKAVILNTLANKLDKSGITIDNISGDANSITKAALSKQGLLADPFHSSIDVKKAALVDKMEKIADTSDSSEEGRARTSRRVRKGQGLTGINSRRYRIRLIWQDGKLLIVVLLKTWG